MSDAVAQARSRIQRLRPSGAVIFVETQAHRIHSFPVVAPNWPSVDVSRIVSADDRRRSVDQAVARIRVAGQSAGGGSPIVAVFDSAESWFPTSVCFRLRRTEPAWALVALQHGVMEITGPESIPVVRWLRRRLCAIEEGIRGYTSVGVGFANAPLEMLVCYGPVYGEYARVINPRVETIESHALLSDLPVGLSVSGVDAARLRRVLFLAQDVNVFGARSPDDLFRRLTRKLRDLEAAGAQVIVKEHPKWTMPGWWMPGFPRAEGTLREVLQRFEIGTVISFNSTGLFDAARAGLRVVALRIPEAHNKWYDMFANAIPIDAFEGSWSFDDFSDVADGFAA